MTEKQGKEERFCRRGGPVYVGRDIEEAKKVDGEGEHTVTAMRMIGPISMLNTLLIRSKS